MFILNDKTAVSALLSLVACAALASGAPALSQTLEEDAEDIAKTPLEDVGIAKDDIPEVLLEAADDPYAQVEKDGCNALVAQIARLDTVLGADYDLAGKENTGLSGKKVAKGIVGSFIPFRSLVREVSGAAGDRRKAEAAVRAGLARRSYLKGLGQGCDYPARPKGS